MRHRFPFFLLAVLLCVPGTLFAQDTMDDVVYLKDGSVIRGTIIEQVPNVNLKIETRAGNVYVIEFSRVAKITKEARRDVTRRKSVERTRFEGSVLLGGAVYDGFYFGTGGRVGASFPFGLYTGVVAVTHFTDADLNISYIGGEIGYEGQVESIMIQPYISAGVGFVGSVTAFYVAPAFALTVWITPNVGIGPDLKYVFVPEAEDGAGGIYIGFVGRF